MTEGTIGIVGVGRMGSNMGRRLRERGYTIAVVCDAAPDLAVDVAAELGAEATQQFARVSDLADIIITVVSDDAAMRTIYAEEGDTLLAHAQGKTFINCATISPALHVAIEALVEARGGSALEACMAGSIPQARAGSLYLMCGGRRHTYEALAPLLGVLGSTQVYTGAAGSAAKVKALVNMVMNINTAGLAEGLGLAEALELDLTMVREVFARTGAASRVLETDGEDMVKREHEAYFTAAHAAKDSGIALALAEGVGLGLPLAEAAKAQYDRMVEEGLGELDKSGIAELTFRSRRGGAL